jgi:hypothetical protein
LEDYLIYRNRTVFLVAETRFPGAQEPQTISRRIELFIGSTRLNFEMIQVIRTALSPYVPEEVFSTLSGTD